MLLVSLLLKGFSSVVLELGSQTGVELDEDTCFLLTVVLVVVVSVLVIAVVVVMGKLRTENSERRHVFAVARSDVAFADAKGCTDVVRNRLEICCDGAIKRGRGRRSSSASERRRGSVKVKLVGRERNDKSEVRSHPAVVTLLRGVACLLKSTLHSSAARPTRRTLWREQAAGKRQRSVLVSSTRCRSDRLPSRPRRPRQPLLRRRIFEGGRVLDTSCMRARPLHGTCFISKPAMPLTKCARRSGC